jgi:hypothetical protein
MLDEKDVVENSLDPCFPTETCEAMWVFGWWAAEGRDKGIAGCASCRLERSIALRTAPSNSDSAYSLSPEFAI